MIVYGDRGDRELALKRAAKHFSLGEFVAIHAAVEVRTPQSGIPYGTRVWLVEGKFRLSPADPSSLLTESKFYWCRPCKAGRYRRPGMKICYWDIATVVDGKVFQGERERGYIEDPDAPEVAEGEIV